MWCLMAVPPKATKDDGEQHRSARKRKAIVEAATTVFLRNGFLGASMDEIAALAGVSKATVYKHFADKQRLFSEVVINTVNEASDPVHDEVVQLADTGDIEADLIDLASRQLARVMQPQLLALRRLVIGESGRFPELGRAFYERGPGRTINALSTTFEGLAARGVLRIDDAPLAAAHFNWLIMSNPINQAMLLGRDGPPPRADLNRNVRAGVRTFLAAYGSSPHTGRRA
jgi:TetR/AcrR family transcriptional regulator, mexJK operon transcriptional repressor